jgi:hypothetical protein
VAVNPRVKALWLAALRSGKFKQGKRRLRIGDQHCCLGVLCEIAVEEGIVERVQDSFTEMYAYRGKGSGYEESSILPFPVAEWAGLGVNPRAGEEVLAALNDRGVTFAAIADIIERDL